MSLSKIVPPSLIQEVFQDAHEKLFRVHNSGGNVQKSIEKMFIAYSKKKAMPNTTEYQNVDLVSYFKLYLELRPEVVGLRWINELIKPPPRNFYVQQFSRSTIPSSCYNTRGSINSDRGPVETSLGDIEELYIDIWIGRIERIFNFKSSAFASKRLNLDRVVKIYYETQTIIKRALSLPRSARNLKLSMIDALYHKVNSIQIFLLKEMCEMKLRCSDSAELSKRKEAFDYILFVLIACIMYRNLKPQLYDIRHQNREAIRNAAPAANGDLFAHALVDTTAYTTRRVLTTSANASSSTTVLPNDVHTFIS